MGKATDKREKGVRKDKDMYIIVKDIFIINISVTDFTYILKCLSFEPCYVIVSKHRPAKRMSQHLSVSFGLQLGES